MPLPAQLPPSDAQIDVAVAWWTKALINPTFKATDRNSGEIGNELLEEATLYMTLATGGPNRYTPEQLATFGATLRDRLKNPDDFEAGADWGLHIDYGPPRQLREALEAAGIDAMGTLPIKTHMSFWNGGVHVWPGYHSEKVVLLAECPPPPPAPDSVLGQALAAAGLRGVNPYIVDGRFAGGPPHPSLDVWDLFLLRKHLELPHEMRAGEVIDVAIATGRWDGGTLSDLLHFASRWREHKDTSVVFAPGDRVSLAPNRYYCPQFRKNSEDFRQLEWCFVGPDNSPYCTDCVLLRKKQ